MKNWLLVVICTACLGMQVRSQCIVALGDQVSYGTGNTWIGYVYDNSNFTSYRGYVNEGGGASPNFDQNFGGNTATFATWLCAVYAETFSVRYKLRRNFPAGYYEFTVGGDDGYRFSINGGSSWLIDNWADHPYTTTTVTVYLNGSYDMVLEYYDNGAENRVSFELKNACVATGDQTVYGTNNVWRGYVYDGTSFNIYKGMVQAGNAVSPYFSQNFGGDNVTYHTNSCPVQTETFSVRYRLRKTFDNGTYLFLVGGDDGYRLSLDGGATWVINAWNDHGYQVSNYTAVLDGTYDLVLEYYENGGGNQVSFDVSVISLLPVELLHFSGEEKNGKVYLDWATANGGHFIVERSSDGKNFSPINEPDGYAYVDASPLPGLNYYRLRMSDKEGITTYSNIVMVKTKAVTSLKLMHNTLYVQSDPNAMVNIFDMQGRLVLQCRANTPVPLQLKGIYHVQVRNAQAILLNKKILLTGN